MQRIGLFRELSMVIGGSHSLKHVRPVLMASRRWFGTSIPKRMSGSIFVHRNTPNNDVIKSPKFKFSPENQKVVKSILAKYPSQYKKAAIIPLLDLAQRQNGGWVSIKAMQHVAEIVEVEDMRVYEVATFYTMFNREPVGKYFIQVCTTTPCELCGSSEIVSTLLSHLGLRSVGETTSDGLFTVVEVECAGACVNAPVFAVNDDYYEDLTSDGVRNLIDQLKAEANGDKLPAGKKKILPGPMSSRKGCEPKTGQTTLNGKPPGPGFGVRSDL